MNTSHTIVGILAVISGIALVASPVSALFLHNDDCGMLKGFVSQRMNGLLDHFEEQGFDVTDIRNALKSGDFKTARTLMQQFREAHADELPAPHRDGNRPCHGIRSMLHARGFVRVS